MVSRGSTVTTYFDGNTRGLSDAARRAEREVEQYGRSVGRVATDSGLSFGKLVGAFSVATIATEGLTDAARFLGSEFRASISAASAMAETQSKVGVVFGESAVAIRAWGEDSASAMGMSTQKALEAAATVGNFAQALGISQQEALKMSPALVQLAADLASFNNANPEETMLALRSGLAGETEPMRRFGVALNAATVEAKALEMGLARTKAEISEADKVTARYALIMEQTNSAQGDFARTSDNLANASRTLTANMENLRAKVGEGVAPALGQAVSKLNDWIESDEGIQFTNDLAAAMSGLVTWTSDAVSAIANLNREVKALSGLSLPDWFATIHGGGSLAGGARGLGERIGNAAQDALGWLFDIEARTGFSTPGRELPRAAGMTDVEVGVLEPSEWPQTRAQQESDRWRRAVESTANQLRRTPEEEKQAETNQFLAQAKLAAEANQRAAEEAESFTRSLGGASGGVSSATDAMAEFEARMREAFDITEARNLQLAHNALAEAELAAAEASRKLAEANEAAARSSQFFLGELQSLAQRGTRFTPEAWRVWAEAAGLNPNGGEVPMNVTIP